MKHKTCSITSPEWFHLHNVKVFTLVLNTLVKSFTYLSRATALSSYMRIHTIFNGSLIINYMAKRVAMAPYNPQWANFTGPYSISHFLRQSHVIVQSDQENMLLAPELGNWAPNSVSKPYSIVAWIPVRGTAKDSAKMFQFGLDFIRFSFYTIKVRGSAKNPRKGLHIWLTFVRFSINGD